MSDQWYYAKGSEKLGPVSEAQLRELAEAGKLLPTDKVWQKGMTEWQDARTVAALFPADGPPPLPSDGSGGASGLKELVWNYICQLWPNKLRFFSMCLLVSVVLTLLTFGLAGFLHVNDIENGFTLPFFLLFVLLDIALLVVVLVYLAPIVSSASNKDAQRVWRERLLCDPKLGPFMGTGNKHWEPTITSLPSLLLFADGGMLRSDGFGAKWKYDAETDAIAITPISGGNPVSLPVVSLTSDELVLSVEGQALHYKKGNTVTGERLAEIRAKQAEFAKNAALVAVSAVAIVGIATVGVLAAAGAAGASGAGGGGGSGGTAMSGSTKECGQCSMRIPQSAKKCPYCGNSKSRYGGDFTKTG